MLNDQKKKKKKKSYSSKIIKIIEATRDISALKHVFVVREGCIGGGWSVIMSSSILNTAVGDGY